MILRGMSRALALAVVGVVSLAIAVLVLPATLLPALLEENRWSEYPGGYLSYLSSMVSFGEDFRGDALLVYAVAFVWALLAVAMLAPIVGRARAASEGRSLLSSVIAAALIGATLAAALALGALEAVLALFAADETMFESHRDQAGAVFLVGGAAVWIGGGFLWMLLLRRASQARDPRGLDRMVRWLFAGTAVELVLGIPLYLIVRKKQDCYCALATFWGLVLGVATLLWMCGPWAVLLVTRKERFAWARDACRRCGYPRRTGAEVCPECGARHEA